VSKRVLFVGYGRAGKDTACEYLEKITTLKNAGTTSLYLCEAVAKKLSISKEEAYSRRHESDDMRMLWYNTGNEIREGDPLGLVRLAFTNGDITGGVRAKEEIVGIRETGIADIIIWIANFRVKKDPTVMFGPEDCDLIIQNNYGIQEFYERIERLAKFASLPLRNVY
jgi:hypothetical protein